MSLKKLVPELIDKLVVEFKKKENVDKVKCLIIDPLIRYSIERLYPYIISIAVLFILTFILAVAIFYIVIKDSFLMK
tara:strand:- start:694 stop:924 length:231 start_codon:yes stop_codon:yes gene_type:complete